jgi:Ca2+-binding RTX toxin-like protein
MDLNLVRSVRLILCLAVCLPLVLVSFVVPLKNVSAVDIEGNDHDNVLYGSMGNDKIFGKGGGDRLFGSGGNDTIEGGSGNDFVQGDIADDIINGNSGNDTVQGGAGNDQVNGDDGNDLVIGSFANSSMSIKDLAADTLTCGTGNDTAFINISDNDTASADCETVIISP